MQIWINGEKRTLDVRPDAAPTIASILEQDGFTGMKVAVARNGSFVPRSAHDNTMLADGDQIEIVAPMQGG